MKNKERIKKLDKYIAIHNLKTTIRIEKLETELKHAEAELTELQLDIEHHEQKYKHMHEAFKKCSTRLDKLEKVQDDTNRVGCAPSKTMGQ